MMDNRNVVINYLLHAGTQGDCIFRCHLPPDLQITVIAVGNGDVDHHRPFWEQVADGLTEYKK